MPVGILRITRILDLIYKLFFKVLGYSVYTLEPKNLKPIEKLRQVAKRV